MSKYIPDEIWSKILVLGVTKSLINYRDLCSLSITSRRLRRLSGHPSLWSTLISLDFPNSSSSNSDPPSKSLYKLRFERGKAKRMLAWRREVLILESNLEVCRRKVRELEGLILKESERMKMVMKEFHDLERVRRASVALNVWQPEVVRGSQNQIIQQCTVPIESRFSSINMEIKLCKQQIAIYKKAYSDQKVKLEKGEETLKSMKYHPIKNFQPREHKANNIDIKRRKLKQTCE